jgi:hypothetical protein
MPALRKSGRKVGKLSWKITVNEKNAHGLASIPDARTCRSRRTVRPNGEVLQGLKSCAMAHY